jgi:putative PEP-CTERM system histidine kinase
MACTSSRHRLLFATAATLVWAVVIAVGTLYPYPPITLIQLAELMRDGGWLFFLLQLLGFQEDGDVRRWLGKNWQPVFAAGMVLALGVVALRPLHTYLPLRASDAADAALALWLAVSVLGLLLVEQVYRNASVSERWGIKFLCLGLGSLFAYDFFMYAEALLFRQLNTQLWQARGLVSALIVPWLLVAIARNRNWRMDVHLSRHIVFQTVTLLVTGLYLIAMAVIGYFIKYLGGAWSGVLQIGFLAASGVVLATLLFSGTIRARLRVFLSKHFFSYRYDYRVEWLRFTEGLTALDYAPTGIIRTMATVAMSPGGFLLYRGAQADSPSWKPGNWTRHLMCNLATLQAG